MWRLNPQTGQYEWVPTPGAESPTGPTPPSVPLEQPIGPGVDTTIGDLYRALTPDGGSSSQPISVPYLWSTRPDIVEWYNRLLASAPGASQIGPPMGQPAPEPPSQEEIDEATRRALELIPDLRTDIPTPDLGQGGVDVSAALADMFANMQTETPAGYTPQFIDTSAAEAMLPLTQTAEERAALEQLLADLEGRAAAGVQAVRTGWESVQALNAAAAERARQLAADAGPRAAALWIDAANNALALSRQAAEAMGTFAGMQGVNISPTSGVQNIAALMAAQAPRAQALAERLGLISAEDIASQGRTAAMMGEAYAADITRQSLIMANEARMEHNERVMNRIAGNQTAIANMRFQAATANAQMANQAAQFAASRAATAGTPAERRQQVLDLAADIEALGTMGEAGIALLAQAYGFDIETARRLIDDTKAGIIDWTTESGIAAATARAAGNG